MTRDTEKIAEEALLLDMNSQELRHLVQHDHEANPRFEACQQRYRNKVGGES